MANNPTNIDDLLLAPKSVLQQEAPPNDLMESTDKQPDLPADNDEPQNDYGTDEPEVKEAEPERTQEVDDYGNEKAPSRTFTEDEVNVKINEAVRDRLSRLERNTGQPQQNQTQVQQATQQGFEYNAESPESWQQQLESFVEQTVTKMGQKQTQQAMQMKEQHAHAEFEQKFRTGMGKFNDYINIVGQQPITDAMTLASRGMNDPAAFFYAASKRAPQELQRIAQIPDQYAQMVEIGKLEERMRQSKTTNGTRTPKPIGKMQEDDPIPHQTKKREPTIEDLIAKDAAKRKMIQDSRRRK